MQVIIVIPSYKAVTQTNSHVTFSYSVHVKHLRGTKHVQSQPQVV